MFQLLPEAFQLLAQQLKINQSDIEEQFVRGSGHGGQKVNKTSSTVLLRHSPTGIEVRCQKHREQSKNRLSAYKLLIQKIEHQIKGNASLQSQKIFKLRKQKQRRSKKAKIKMLAAKKLHSTIKSNRGSIRID
ncbi:peptide chain release factor-like protein [Candidatus Gracilibacteria bacterium]|nr:peptide chain release factor-like protein [Candidatus Gracilibacteria bacterium]